MNELSDILKELCIIIYAKAVTFEELGNSELFKRKSAHGLHVMLNILEKKQWIYTKNDKYYCHESIAHKEFPELIDKPVFVKDMKNRVVTLARNVTTKSGNTFFKGQKMIIREASKKKKTLVLKPIADQLIINIDTDALSWK